MDSKNMNELLQKYWEGTSTLEEETTLVQYFNEGEVAEEHKAYAPVFNLIGSYRKSELPVEFEARLHAKLKDTTPAVVTVKTTTSGRKVFHLRRTLSIAASFVLLITATYFLMPTLMGNQKTDLYTDTFESPEAAAQEIKVALGTLSAKMSESTAMIEDEMKKLDQANSLTY